MICQNAISSIRRHTFNGCCYYSTNTTHFFPNTSCFNKGFVKYISNKYQLSTPLVQSIIHRKYVTAKPKNDSASSSKSTELTETPRTSAVSTSVKEKVKENVETTAYGGVILIGIAVTGALAYMILSELFSSDSPNNIYSKSFELCKADLHVQDALGTPLKCHGEETRKGWRRHVAHEKFLFGDRKYIRMKFYIQGKFNKGTVYLEKKTDDQGKFQYNYLVVDVETYPPRRIEVNV